MALPSNSQMQSIVTKIVAQYQLIKLILPNHPLKYQKQLTNIYWTTLGRQLGTHKTNASHHIQKNEVIGKRKKAQEKNILDLDD